MSHSAQLNHRCQRRQQRTTWQTRKQTKQSNSPCPSSSLINWQLLQSPKQQVLLKLCGWFNATHTTLGTPEDFKQLVGENGGKFKFFLGDESESEVTTATRVSVNNNNNIIVVKQVMRRGRCGDICLDGEDRESSKQRHQGAEPSQHLQQQRCKCDLRCWFCTWWNRAQSTEHTIDQEVVRSMSLVLSCFGEIGQHSER